MKHYNDDELMKYIKGNGKDQAMEKHLLECKECFNNFRALMRMNIILEKSKKGLFHRILVKLDEVFDPQIYQVATVTYRGKNISETTLESSLGDITVKKTDEFYLIAFKDGSIFDYEFTPANGDPLSGRNSICAEIPADLFFGGLMTIKKGEIQEEVLFE